MQHETMSQRLKRRLYGAVASLALTSTGLGLATANAAFGESQPAGMQPLLQSLITWIAAEFDRNPAIVLGGGVALAIPLLAIVGLLLRRQGRAATGTPDRSNRSIPISGWNARGLLVVANSRGEVHEIGHGLVRIGREKDNDVQLVHKTVHRYHAVVERTPEAEFYVTDVSGAGGNGVKIDGSRVERARLRGGEMIEVGKARLRFQLAEARNEPA